MFFGFGIFFDHFSDVLIFSALHVGQFTEGLPIRFCSNSLPHFLQVPRRGSGLTIVFLALAFDIGLTTTSLVSFLLIIANISDSAQCLQ